MSDQIDRLIQAPAAGDVPTGFRATPSGLVVPEDVSRQQETWSPDEWAVFEAAAKLAVKKGAIMRLFCMTKPCDGVLIEMSDFGPGRRLRCDHKDRRVWSDKETATNKQAKSAARHQRKLRRRFEQEVARQARHAKPPHTPIGDPDVAQGIAALMTHDDDRLGPAAEPHDAD